MRVLTDPAETGAVTLCLPQDVQAEAYDFQYRARRAAHLAHRPAASRPRRPRPRRRDDPGGARTAHRRRRRRAPLRGDRRPPRARRADRSPGRGDAGREGSPPLRSSALALGAIGATGTRAANLVARDADPVLGVGTRYADFTTASRTAFQHTDVRLVNVNVGARDAAKLGGCALVGDARATLELLLPALAEHHVSERYEARARSLVAEWDAEVDRLVDAPEDVRPTQAQVIGAVNDAAGETGIMVCAAGSMPGDLHKLWRPRHSMAYHVEYGYSCMGYEVAGGLGVRLAEPDREVFVMVGDGSWLLMSSELVTAAEQGVRITCVLVDNYGYGSIGGLSRSLGSNGFGTARSVGVDLEANARSLGAEAVRVDTLGELRAALAAAPEREHSTVVVIECDPLIGVPSYESTTVRLLDLGSALATVPIPAPTSRTLSAGRMPAAVISFASFSPDTRKCCPSCGSARAAISRSLGIYGGLIQCSI